MTVRKLFVSPLLLLALASGARGAEPRADGEPPISAEVRARFAAGEAAVPVLIAFRAPQQGRRPLAAPPTGVDVRRSLRGGVAATVTRAGLEALARDPDVAAVALDGVVHPSGQVGTAQIGADRLVSLGLDGAGRSVAIVDTGIDTTSRDLGGGSIPNAKVWAGWNVVTKNADVSDCAGHGTEVAGVIAGPQGVAPGAGLVVLKVFGGSLGCDRAMFSDVLAAVEWAVEHRDALHIEAINLSLSGEALRTGFCDAEDPLSAAAFTSARQAGVAVLAAAGNEGRPDGIAWPGCFSDVTAIGMVYSGSVGGVTWDGVASCLDRYTGADIVPCASNSGSALGLLAPGVRWVTTAPGGAVTQSFSGTSAASPAAAAAFLLARQARPASDPALVLDQLRATGVPVVDDKNGRTASRIDLSAAIDATTPVTGDCDAAAIPDGVSSGLTCTADVSAFAGNVSSITVALSIDHPDPSQLLVSLVGPDGTSVLLMNRMGTRGRAVREVFGRTAPPAEPLSGFAGRPASGTWQLQVTDTTPGDAGRLVSWALQIEPEAPRAAAGPLLRTAVLPTVVHGAGRFGSFFTSDLRLFNADPVSPQVASVRLRSASGETPDRSVTVTIPPLGTRVLSDVVGDAFRASDYGPLFLAASPSVLAGSRTSATAAAGGRYGLYVPSVAATAGITAVTPPLTLVPAFRGTSFRVNVGLTEVSGSDADVEVTIKDGHGAPKGVVTAHAGSYALLQVNDVYARAAATIADDDRIEVRVVGGTGRVVPFATAVDNRSNDGAFVGGAAAVTDLLLPAVANASGLYGAVFRTDLKIANTGASPIRVRVSYVPSLGAAAGPVVVSLGVGETRLVPDVLATLLGLPAPAAGALRLTGLEGARLVASSRTWAEGSTGTFGLSFDPSVAGGRAGAGARLALTFLSSSASTRTNVGFIETEGKPTSARVSLYGTDGTRLAVRDLDLEAGSAVQWNDVFGTMGVGHGGEGSAIVEVLSGGMVAGYSVSVDNRTNDASLVPATLLP